jgi:predicted methyltransferase
MSWSKRFVVVFVLVLLAPAVCGQEPNINPGINATYRNPDYQRWVNVFERPGREVFDRRWEILEATAVKPGMVVADIGAGTGLFTRLFAPRVGPHGRVIAVDISRTFIDNILRTAAQLGLGNIEGVVNTDREVALPAGSIDLAFVCDTFHHFEYPQTMLHSIHRALRPGGTLVIIDFRRVPGYSSPWVLRHVRTGREAVSKEVEAAGFRLLEAPDVLRTNYFLRFEKI